MSLIEEALRKQREESEKTGSVSIAPPPIPSEPAEIPPEPPIAEEHARRPWALLAGIAVASILAILFVAWLLIYGLKLWQTKPTPAQINASITTNAPKALPVTTAAPSTNTTTKPLVAPQTPPPQPVATTPAPPPATTTPATLPATQAPTVAPKTDPTATLAPKSAPPPQQSITPAPDKLELPVMWPKLTVSGIIGSSKSGRSAVILNGQMLSPGDTIEGVSIESVDKQKVKLKYSGETKMLSVGASTE